jgi:hypothetical protein
MGSVQLAEVIDTPEFYLVGLFIETTPHVLSPSGRRGVCGKDVGACADDAFRHEGS